jgi:signal peptidase I
MKRALAMGLSLVIPGGGQIYRGHTRRGLLVWAGVLIVVASIPWTRVAGCVATFVLYLGNAIDAALVDERPAPRGALYVPLLVLAAYLIVRIGVRGYLVEAYKIPSGGMTPTLQIGDHFFVAKFQRTPRRGDVIAFDYPRDPGSIHIERVVGVAGDRVRVARGVLILNDEPVPSHRVGEESYLDRNDPSGNWTPHKALRVDEELGGRRYETYHDPGADLALFDFPRSGDAFTVPDGTVFVVGDNRENSHDSRFWGPLPLANVIGKPLFIWWSQGPDHIIRWDRLGKALD